METYKGTMKITFLGTGGAFASAEQGQSNMLIESDSGKKLLIDCGMTAPYQLEKLGLTANDIDAVYISHLHADHVGGMEWLGYMTYFTGDKKPELYCETNLMTQLWETTLQGGMKTIKDNDATLETYFDCYPVKVDGLDIESEDCFSWEGCVFDLIPLIHVHNKDNSVISYGLTIYEEATGRATYISTDTTAEESLPYIDSSDAFDVIFHECEIGFVSGVHSPYDVLNTLDPDVKKKMWLYHYSNECDVEADGFNGLVKTFDTFGLFTGERLTSTSK